MNKHRSRMTQRQVRSPGQALAEFALVAPIFFLVLFGIIEAGRFMFYYETLNNATREGARYAIVNGANSLTCSTGPAAPDSTSCDPDGSDVVDRTRAAAFGIPPAAVTVTPTWMPDNGRGSRVKVRAAYTYSSLIPLVPLPPVTVEAESTLVVNN
jgi:Flp pilus assembly protein TadG